MEQKPNDSLWFIDNYVRNNTKDICIFSLIICNILSCCKNGDKKVFVQIYWRKYPSWHVFTGLLMESYRSIPFLMQFQSNRK